MDIEFATWGISLDFWSQWVLPWRNNWVDFTVINLGGEYSPYKGSSEVEVGLLGFGLRVTVWKRHSPRSKELNALSFPELGIEPVTIPDANLIECAMAGLCTSCGKRLADHDLGTGACSKVEL